MIKNILFYSFLITVCYVLLPIQVGEYGFYWSELKRQAEIQLKNEKVITKLGPMLDNCNLCVWGTCTPAINPVPASKSQLAEDVSSLVKEFTGRSLRSPSRDLITSILTSRSEAQREEVIRGFEAKTQISLADGILTEYSRYRYGVLMGALATPLDEFYAYQLRAIANQRNSGRYNGQDSRNNRISIVQMFTTLSPCLIRKIIKFYNNKFGKDTFETDVVNVFKGPVSLFSNSPEVIQRMAKANRDDAPVVSWTMAVADAKMMRLGIVTDTWKKKKDSFMRIFTERSIPQIAETIRVYEKLREKDEGFVSLDNDINDHMESMKEIYGTMVEIIRNQPLYFAKAFYEMLNHSKVDHVRFIYLIRGRCDIDLDDIKNAYKDKYKETLKTTVDSRDREGGAYNVALSKILA